VTADSAPAPDLLRADPEETGLTRRGRGKGFEYFEPGGEKIHDDDTIERLNSLAIPPAWDDVWICPDPHGHLQALGTDDAGRRQYRYHDRWRERRDVEKFDRVLDFARTLPRLRRHCRELLEVSDEPTRDRVLAATVRLLEHGFFRIGSEAYAEESATYGLTTVLKEQVTVRRDGVIVFDYPAKGGIRRTMETDDPLLVGVIGKLRRRRGGGDELLAYRAGGAWRDLTAADVNEELKGLCDRDDVSAKDFRTWNATVLAAVGLAVSGEVADSERARTRAKRRVADEVAGYLGNTPTVARDSYIDARVFARYDEGWIIAEALTDLAGHTEPGEPSYHGRIEEAVLDLLDDRGDTELIEDATDG
jgi:DNA topoisomerase IB